MSKALKTLRSQAMRARIVAAAARAFSRRGVGETRVDHILEMAEISRRTLYQYFRSKDEILEAIFEATAGQVLTLLRTPMVGEVPQAALHLGIEAFFDFQRDSGPLLRELFHVARHPTSPLAPRREELHAAVFDIVRAVAERAGRPRPTDLALRALMGALEGLTEALFAPECDEVAFAAAKRLMSELLDGTVFAARHPE